MKSKRHTIMLTGGGTGGHLYPALSLAKHVQDRFEVVYVGHPDKIEGRVVPGEGIAFHPLVAVPFTSRPTRLPGFLWHFFRSLLRAYGLLRRLRPALVVGFGGYVSLPVGLVARVLGIPVAIHEQNVHGGLANRLLIRVGALALTTFPGTRLPTPRQPPIVTGCPVRREIGSLDRMASRRDLGLPVDRTICLVMGGSGGARFLNETLLEVLSLAAHRKDWFFLHVTGQGYLEETRAMVARRFPDGDLQERYRMEGYITEIARYYAAADLAICRGGSATVNELSCAGLPAILIPSPNVTDNHQEGNARHLEAVGAAEVMLEREVTPQHLYDRLTALLDHPEKRAVMADNGRKHALGHKALGMIETALRQHCPVLND
ncbi:MAG: UDP-N-acetylglucosamine--N-acetylmuramyl-(pentapeptide) pyrophosphoryl-undecaprenol N-acetylglucosamine transferase [Magnetococcales bacterium]|nr:UDP-N-acetylglucosamine--N-acetylmuramyl-(pentapeptide) pyrophosphoryl-undecaprenol N-acetylglucosamine transferase [Magnetococcales bacterium]MBF0150466.1 UDP-N-acetylglucosamine--N-acetylmuramyl-(pentapeptide) pyrophosphoryl-undecaprenol N-acetylglucosamine transferase [Magnetococcales bacterium]MBF0174693.1 UDP-N-acetylglucosamine--N-acetylmuramyl-(pentapeptide) pyrophosphoryl-undecaprenol N-acetylglucosamine transferase [Magnetococcales bacterium]MBF0348142.1 UDP-N-acetylglucosamine--N-ac